MTRTIFLTFTLLCCTAWMVAQSTPSSSYPSSSGSSSSQTSTGSSAGQSSTGQSSASDQSAMSGSEQTIQGCLASSGGSYTLTDAAGTQYQLEGDTSKLSAHVNSEVEVKGTAASGSSASANAGSAGSSAPSSSTPSSAGSSSSGAGAAKTFNVTKVKKISSSCSTAK